MNMINLLPPQYKQRIRAAKKIRVAVNIGILVIISLVIFWFSLIIINTYLSSVKESQTFSVVKEKAKVFQLEKIKEEIGKLNVMITGINKFYGEQVMISDLLIHLSNILSREVELNNLSFDKVSRQVIITGTVQSLSGLNNLKDILNNQEKFKAVNITIPSYIPKQDINFKADFLYE